MLDSGELARRLREAMDKAAPPVTSAALARACKVTPQAVNGWRKTGRMAKRHLKIAAGLTKRSLEYFLGEDPSAAPALPTDAPSLLTAREELLLHLFGGLFSLQQREAINEMRALFDANQVTRKELGQRPLRGVSDAQVEAAFKITPGEPPSTPKTQRRVKRSDRTPGREPGTELDDFRE